MFRSALFGAPKATSPSLKPIEEIKKTNIVLEEIREEDEIVQHIESDNENAMEQVVDEEVQQEVLALARVDEIVHPTEEEITKRNKERIDSFRKKESIKASKHAKKLDKPLPKRHGKNKPQRILKELITEASINRMKSKAGIARIDAKGKLAVRSVYYAILHEVTRKAIIYKQSRKRVMLEPEDISNAADHLNMSVYT